MVSFTRGQYFSSSDPSDNSSSTLTSVSSLSSETLHWLETPYIDKVYHAMPLVVSYPGEEEERGNTATTFSSPSVSRAFQRRKRILAEEVDKEEDKE